MVKSSEITVPMEPELEQMIEGQLGYGDSKAEYIREAVRQRLEAEGVEAVGTDTETDGGQTQLAD
jgi:Arc/MetJ-type ribon-helix-helix transcriptional regulator